MTEHQTMNTIIHAAVRRDLARFDAALEEFPGSQERADQLWIAWENLAHQLREHHEHEETIFWPALRELGADESLVSDLDGEHQQMLTGLESANQAMTTLHLDPTADNARTAREAVGVLGATVVDHFEHEERDLEPFTVAKLKGSPQGKAAGAAVRKAQKGQVGTFVAWLLDGADADARAGLSGEIPAPVVFMINRLGGRDYRRRIAPVWS